MKTQSIYFLENNQGQAVRALPADLRNSEVIHFVFREDTRRLEVVSDLSVLDKNKIAYKLLETLKKDQLTQKKRHKLSFTNSELTLVEEIVDVQENQDLPEDDSEKFVMLLKKTSLVGGALLSVILVLSFFLNRKAEEKEELRVIQVIDREKTEPLKIVKPSEMPVAKAKVISRSVQPQKIVKKIVKNQFARKKSQSMQLNQVGALAVLGNVQNSSQRGGLRLDQARTSRGPGRGGDQGSGGVQTAVYAKGLFAAPVGTGNRADGAGGYGTKGKGGGQGGYGEIKLAGSAGSFFEPIENEVWTEGGLDRNEIAAVIQRHLSEVRFCYEKGLQKNSKLSGRVSMKFLIGPEGYVTSANVGNSSLNYQPSETCIRDRLKTWKFPKPQGGVTVKVNYPFVLRRVTDS
ncbi:MAG: AgmX/PglI C-terminal domain-containing protein [Bdellovibrionota bacterium]